MQGLARDNLGIGTLRFPKLGCVKVTRNFEAIIAEYI
jgi:hypothetical protein